MKQKFEVFSTEMKEPQTFTVAIDIDQFGNINIGEFAPYVPTLKDLWKQHVKESIPN